MNPKTTSNATADHRVVTNAAYRDSTADFLVRDIL